MLPNHPTARGQQQQIFQLNLDTKPAGSEVDEVGLLASGRPRGSRPSEGRQAGQARRQGGGLRPPEVGHLLLLYLHTNPEAILVHLRHYCLLYQNVRRVPFCNFKFAIQIFFNF